MICVIYCLKKETQLSVIYILYTILFTRGGCKLAIKIADTDRKIVITAVPSFTTFRVTPTWESRVIYPHTSLHSCYLLNHTINIILFQIHTSIHGNPIAPIAFEGSFNPSQYVNEIITDIFSKLWNCYFSYISHRKETVYFREQLLLTLTFDLRDQRRHHKQINAPSTDCHPKF